MPFSSCRVCILSFICVRLAPALARCCSVPSARPARKPNGVRKGPTHGTRRVAGRRATRTIARVHSGERGCGREGGHGVRRVLFRLVALTNADRVADRLRECASQRFARPWRCVYARARVRACARACMCVCVCACVRVRVVGGRRARARDAASVHPDVKKRRHARAYTVYAPFGSARAPVVITALAVA